MLANYHAHTVRCKHATGTPREYILRAIGSGYQVFGFSDHTPYPFPKSYTSPFRMGLDEVDAYVQAVLDLKREFAGQIEIPLGLEVEYYPALFPQLLDALRGYPIEYFLLGQHYLGNETGDFYSGQATADPTVLRRYCDQTIEAMETGRFTYFAHPDLPRFVGEETVYITQMTRLCQAAKDCEMPLEINFLGIHDSRHYPAQRFWRIAGEVGNQVVFGCDTHHLESFAHYPAAEQKALAMASAFGLRRLETVPLRRPV